MANRHRGQSTFNLAHQVVALPLQLQRTKRDLVEYRWVEQLNVRVLEDKGDVAAETEREPLVLQANTVDGFPSEEEFASRREAEGVQNSQQGGLAGAVCAQQRDSFPRGDREGEPMQGRNALIVETQIARFKSGEQFTLVSNPYRQRPGKQKSSKACVVACSHLKICP